MSQEFGLIGLRAWSSPGHKKIHTDWRLYAKDGAAASGEPAAQAARGPFGSSLGALLKPGVLGVGAHLAQARGRAGVVAARAAR